MTLHPLELLAAQAMLESGWNPCREGHAAWVSLGGCACPLGPDDPGPCSRPVMHCEVCGDSDYGESEEADAHCEQCRLGCHD